MIDIFKDKKSLVQILTKDYLKKKKKKNAIFF